MGPRPRIVVQKRVTLAGAGKPGTIHRQLPPSAEDDLEKINPNSILTAPTSDTTSSAKLSQLFLPNFTLIDYQMRRAFGKTGLTVSASSSVPCCARREAWVAVLAPVAVPVDRASRGLLGSCVHVATWESGRARSSRAAGRRGWPCRRRSMQASSSHYEGQPPRAGRGCIYGPIGPFDV